MNIQTNEGKIGTPWIIAIVALLVLLVLGIVLYSGMKVRIEKRPRTSASAWNDYNLSMLSCVEACGCEEMCDET